MKGSMEEVISVGHSVFELQDVTEGLDILEVEKKKKKQIFFKIPR